MVIGHTTTLMERKKELRIISLVEEMESLWCGMRMGKSKEMSPIKMTKIMVNGFIGLIMESSKKKRNIQMAFRQMVNTMIILTISKNSTIK